MLAIRKSKRGERDAMSTMPFVLTNGTEHINLSLVASGDPAEVERFQEFLFDIHHQGIVDGIEIAQDAVKSIIETYPFPEARLLLQQAPWAFGPLDKTFIAWFKKKFLDKKQTRRGGRAAGVN